MNNSTFKCYNCNNNIICNCLLKNNKLNNNCPIHSLKYDFFCNKTKIDLCDECKKKIPYFNKENELQKTIDEYHKKIQNLSTIIQKEKELILNRYEKLKQFLDFLLRIINIY